MEPTLTEDRLRSLIELVGDIVAHGKTFKVFPPAEVTQDPDVLDRDDAAAKLLATKWWLRFADGGEQLVLEFQHAQPLGEFADFCAPLCRQVGLPLAQT